LKAHAKQKEQTKKAAEDQKKKEGFLTTIYIILDI